MSKSTSAWASLHLWVLGIVVSLLGCHGHARVAGPVKDTTAAAVGPVDDVQVFYDQYIASYTRPCVIDSAFELGSGHYRLYVKDSCLMDSAITIPRKYVSMYKLDSFVTHNFISNVRLEKDGKTILERVITRKDFDGLIDESLRKYSVMFCPHMHLKGDSVLVEYSISIPLTDVGRLMYAVIDHGGNVTFREPGAED